MLFFGNTLVHVGAPATKRFSDQLFTPESNARMPLVVQTQCASPGGAVSQLQDMAASNALRRAAVQRGRRVAPTHADQLLQQIRKDRDSLVVLKARTRSGYMVQHVRNERKLDISTLGVAIVNSRDRCAFKHQTFSNEAAYAPPTTLTADAYKQNKMRQQQQMGQQMQQMQQMPQ